MLGLTYYSRLRMLNLESLEIKGLRAYLLLAYRILFGLININTDRPHSNAGDTQSRILYKKFTQVDLHKKLDCMSCFPVQGFWIRILHQIEQSSVRRKKLADT